MIILKTDNGDSVEENLNALKEQLKNPQITRNVIIETMDILHNKIIDNKCLIRAKESYINLGDSSSEQYNMSIKNALRRNEIYLLEYQFLQQYLVSKFDFNTLTNN